MTDKVYNIYVPSEGSPESKIWIVGEAPGWDEECERRPFIGTSGKILNNVMARAGLSRDDCFITNLCHYRPHGNVFEHLTGSWELAEGLAELEGLCANNKPNIIIALGSQPLSYFTEKNGITKYRGSILRTTKHELKVLPTFHPAFIVRKGQQYPIFDMDIRKAAFESTFPEIIEPVAKFDIANTPDKVEYWRDLLLKKDLVSCDIETVKHTTEILCVGFAFDANNAVCFPFTYDVVGPLNDILRSKAEKIFQNGNFDKGVLEINHIKVNNYNHDVMLQAHVLEPELPKDLAFLTSIYTRWPYYKEEGRADIPSDTKSWSKKVNKESLYIYNMKDCVVTFEIHQKQIVQMDKEQRAIYEYEMGIQQCLLDMSTTGMLRDHGRLSLMNDAVTKKIDSFEQSLCDLAKHPVNPKSPKQVNELLYRTLKLPVRTARETGNETSDEDALIGLLAFCTGKVNELKTEKSRLEWRIKLGVIKLILELRGLHKLKSSYIDATEYNGRICSFYKQTTETGRLACSNFFDGSGINAQTVPREEIEVDEDRN